MAAAAAAESKAPAAAAAAGAPTTEHDTVAVVDFGGQYAHLIATKVRNAHVRAEILQPEDSIEKFSGYKGIILSGGPRLLSQGDSDADWTTEVFNLDVPILGLCFGHQQMATRYGGNVTHGTNVEWGYTTLHIKREHPLFEGLGAQQTVWMSHYDTVESLGEGFEEIGYTSTTHTDDGASSSDGAGVELRGPNAAICDDARRRYGFQFHPEVDASENGERMLQNFVLGICGCKPTWQVDAQYLQDTIAQIRAEVAGRGVFLLCSGGVDSTVAAKLFQEALEPGQLKLLHIDNGMMRKDESAQVIQYFEQLGMSDSLTFVDATDEFLQALEGEVAPEKKRKIIGNTFIQVYEREAARMGIEGFMLGQGTIYPDTIESGGTKHAHVIKTHHNRVALVEQMIAEGRVVEPLKDLYKTEVRALARQLGVPQPLLARHPFPGPGLGVRLLCSRGPDSPPDVTAELAAALQHFDGIVGKLIPIQSVGVKGDIRSYEYPVLLSSATPGSGAGPTWETLLEACRVVLRDVSGVNRVVWNLAGTPPPQTFECLAAGMTKDRLDLLREADDQVMEGLRRHGLYDSIWQCPTAMVPIRVDGEGTEMIILRPVHTKRAMTAKPAALPEALIGELRESVLGLEGVSGLAIDLTSKPPGTIEWE